MNETERRDLLEQLIAAHFALSGEEYDAKDVGAATVTVQINGTKGARSFSFTTPE